jgi:hypothetical protein
VEIDADVLAATHAERPRFSVSTMFDRGAATMSERSGDHDAIGYRVA